MMASIVKKRKVDTECRIFQDKWTSSYLFVQQGEKALCLVCKDTVAVFKEHNIKRHYDAKHKTKFDGFVGLQREEKISQLRNEIGGLKKLFNQKQQSNEAAVKASFRIAHILSKAAKPFSDGELVKKCMLAIVEEMCPEQKKVIETVSLSRNTVTRRVEELGGNLLLQLQNAAKTFEVFSIATDESTDISDTAQLLVFIRGVNSEFKITEELAAMQSLYGTTTAEDLFREVSAVIEKCGLLWNKLVSVTTDGARSMVGRQNGLVAKIRRKVLNCNGSRPMELHCIIHQQQLCGKVLNLDHIMRVVTKTVNFIRSHALNHRTFKEFLDKIDSEYEDVVYHSEVRWLSRGKVLKRFFDLRHEIDKFLKDKSKEVPELSDSSWLWDLAILCDITSHLNELNLKLMGKMKLISNVYGDLKAFHIKLQLFIQQGERNQFLHFPTCEEMRKELDDDSFPKKRLVELLTLLKENFDERFSDFRGIHEDIRCFENPFLVDPSTAPVTVQLELIELQCQTSLHDKFRDQNLVDFYAELSSVDFPNLKNQALKMISVFASTFICEQAFSVLKRAKPILRNRITDDHLHSVLRINVSSFEPDIQQLVTSKQLQTSH